MPDPAVSVLMAIRNEERWLPATLDSLRSQTRTDFEVVAVDDGSTDATPDILRAADDLPITVIRTDGVGLGAARNLAIEAANALLFAVLDADDLWLPCYVERVVGRLESDPGVAIVSPELLVAVDEEISDERYYADGHPLRWYDDDQLLHLVEGNFIVPMSTYRREVVKKVGVYDPSPGVMEDWDLWIRALRAGFRAGHDPEPCGIYRLRSGSITSNRSALIKGRIALLEGLTEIAGPVGVQAQMSLTEQQLQLYIAEAKEALRSGDLSKARSSFRSAAAHPSASPKQQAGALVAASLPRLGQFVLKTRQRRSPMQRSVRDIRRERE